MRRSRLSSVVVSAGGELCISITLYDERIALFSDKIVDNSHWPYLYLGDAIGRTTLENTNRAGLSP